MPQAVPESPRVLILEDEGQDVARWLRRCLDELGVESPFVLASQQTEELASDLRGPLPHQIRIADGGQHWALEIGSAAKAAGADALVAIGGGRCLDIGKLAAARAGLAVVTVPTQLSHDGICSPVAVVPDDAGRIESLGAVVPRAVCIPLPVVARAPIETVRAGLGDLLANPLALRDWALAAERGLEEVNDQAWELSVQSFALIEPHLDSDVAASVKERRFLRRLADALVLSGRAMICCGTSRPASGAEHEVSHAVDRLYGGRALHGAQVAFGCVVSVGLFGDDTDAFRRRLKTLGLPQHPAELGLGLRDVVDVLLAAPDTRPGRFTVLEDANLDEAGARALVAKIWDDRPDAPTALQ